MTEFHMSGSRGGKTLAAINATKAAQRRGENVVWATNDQAATAATLSKYGALVEIIGECSVIPHFREPSDG